VKIILIVIYGASLAWGLILFILLKKNTHIGHQSLVRLFCLTDGRSNDFIAKIISIFSTKLNIDSSSGILGDMAGVEGDKAIHSLREDGYVVFDSKLSAKFCQNLYAFSLSANAKVREMDEQLHGEDDKIRHYSMNEVNPIAVRYEYSRGDLLANKIIQNLLCDSSILKLSERYLGAAPIADVLEMWWHTNYSIKADKKAAQYYHFDLDRVKWLKFFIYITDVGVNEGPHSFIAGTHKSNAIPHALLKKGYSRIDDDEVFSCLDKSREVTFVAKRGTIIIEDTRGLHKGNRVIGKPRLILQLQFSNSLFGAAHPKESFPELKIDALKKSIMKNKNVYKNFI
jgi:hypothetical protein